MGSRHQFARRVATLAIAFVAFACGAAHSSDAGFDSGVDASTVRDGATRRDGGSAPEDASTSVDASDGGPRPDADANSADAGPGDASADAALDAHVPDGGPSPDASPVNPCQSLRAVCVFAPEQCSAAGGILRPAGDPGCVFSDGPGRCCEPPAAQPTGDGCSERGGVCAPLVGCDFVRGWFGPESATCDFSAFEICCLPGDVCGAMSWFCCDPSGPTSYRPACDRGSPTCDDLPGSTLLALGAPCGT